VAQDMVSVTLTVLRLASSAADTAAVAGAAAGLENEFISSIRVGLVTGQAVDAALVHQKATAHQRSRGAVRWTFAAAGQGARIPWAAPVPWLRRRPPTQGVGKRPENPAQISEGPRETLENPARLRENGAVIAGQDWVDGRQAARLLRIRGHSGTAARCLDQCIFL
jgi:hypothetical protein